MEISSNFNICPQKPKSVSFGQKYPYGDVMSIMSSSFVTGIEESVEKTVSSLIKGKHNPERYLDHLEARSILLQKCPDLIPNSEHFRERLNNITYNHFAITVEDARNVIDTEAALYGSKFVDVV